MTVNGKESLDYYNHSPFEQNNKKNPVGVKETGIWEKKRGGGEIRELVSSDHYHKVNIGS